MAHKKTLKILLLLALAWILLLPANAFAAQPLKWTPPVLTNPLTVHITAGQSYAGPYPDDQDVILVMPNSVRTRRLDVQGGHNIQVIGGDLAPTTSSDARVLRFQYVTGSVYLEGLLIDGGGLNGGDGIDVYPPTGSSYRPDVYVQNTRIVNINGSSGGVHGDCFQPQGPVGNLYFNQVTCTSNYQGFFIPDVFGVKSATFQDVDMSYTNNTGYTFLLWLSNACEIYPISLNNVYATPRNGQTLLNNTVYPTSSVPSGCALAAQGSDVYWPTLTSVHGTVKLGPPPGGQYVPASAVGLSYSSPGWAAPSQPTSFTGPSTTTDKKPSFSWTDPDNAPLSISGYRIQWSRTADFSSEVTSVDTTDMSCVVTSNGCGTGSSLSNGTWYVRVAAIDTKDQLSDYADLTTLITDAKGFSNSTAAPDTGHGAPTRHSPVIPVLVILAIASIGAGVLLFFKSRKPKGLSGSKVRD